MVRTRQKLWVHFSALQLGSERSEEWLYLLFYEIKTTTLRSFVIGKNWDLESSMKFLSTASKIN